MPIDGRYLIERSLGIPDVVTDPEKRRLRVVQLAEEGVTADVKGIDEGIVLRIARSVPDELVEAIEDGCMDDLFLGTIDLDRAIENVVEWILHRKFDDPDWTGEVVGPLVRKVAKFVEAHPFDDGRGIYRVADARP